MADSRITANTSTVFSLQHWFSNTHVWTLLVFSYNSQITLQLNPAGKYTSYLFAFQNTTVSVHSKSLLYIPHGRKHSNVFRLVLRYYGNATHELLRNSTATLLWIRYQGLIYHIAPSLRLLVPSSPQVRRQSVQVYHYHSRPGVPLDSVDDIVDPGDDLVRAFPCRL
jgi:hypothetical protein